VGVEHRDGPRDHDDHEVVQVLAQEELEDRPLGIAEHRVPAAHHQVEDLFSARDHDRERLPEDAMARQPGRISSFGVDACMLRMLADPARP
jgi:hypothetical protein